ncbi:MAG: DoxX family protein [Calditrichia bacterium]
MIKMHKIDKFLDANKDIGILLLRLFIGARLFYGVIDNVLSWEHMLLFSEFLQANGFPFPLLSAVVSVYVQLIGSIMILVGYKIRIAAFVLAINFIVALLMVHLPAGDTIEGMTPALAMLFGCLTLFFTGAEKFSLNNSGKAD